MRRQNRRVKDATIEELVLELTARSGHRPMLVDDLAGVLAEADTGFLVAELERRGAPATSSQEAWNAGWAAAMAAWGVSRETSPLGAEVLASGPFEVSDEPREALVVPTRACVALGGHRSTVCGRAVDDDAEGDLCPMHQEEATAIGRDLVALLTRLRWVRDD